MKKCLATGMAMAVKPDHVAEPGIRGPEIVKRLKKRYPGATTALDWSNPLELLIATILSAQCTDAKVNEVTRDLFKRYRTAKDYADADPNGFQHQIQPTGFFRRKTSAVIGACRAIVERFGGNVPSTMDELITLPGVARKTGNVVLGTAFGKNEGIAVDTHVGRISVRLALAPSASGPKDAAKIECDLMRIIPRRDWTFFAHAMILHGRETCRAKKPRHDLCVLVDLCPTGSDRIKIENAKRRTKNGK